MATKYEPSPYKESGILASFKGRNKPVIKKTKQSYSIRGAFKSGHVWQGSLHGMYTCRLCNNPQFIVGDKKCRGKRK